MIKKTFLYQRACRCLFCHFELALQSSEAARTTFISEINILDLSPFVSFIMNVWFPFAKIDACTSRFQESHLGILFCSNNNHNMLSVRFRFMVTLPKFSKYSFLLVVLWGYTPYPRLPNWWACNPLAIPVLFWITPDTLHWRQNRDFNLVLGAPTH